jgi:hypothetical protein
VVICEAGMPCACGSIVEMQGEPGYEQKTKVELIDG